MTTRVLIIAAKGIRLADIQPQLESAFSRPGADYEVITICNNDRPGFDIDWDVEAWARAKGFKTTIGFGGVSESMWHVDGHSCMVFGTDARCQVAIRKAKRGVQSPWTYWRSFKTKSQGVNLRVLEGR